MHTEYGIKDMILTILIIMIFVLLIFVRKNICQTNNIKNYSDTRSFQ